MKLSKRFYPTRISESSSRNENRCETDTASHYRVQKSCDDENFLLILFTIFFFFNTTITFAATTPTDEILTTGDFFSAHRESYRKSSTLATLLFDASRKSSQARTKNIEFLRVLPPVPVFMETNEPTKRLSERQHLPPPLVIIPKITQQDAVIKVNHLTKIHRGQNVRNSVRMADKLKEIVEILPVHVSPRTNCHPKKTNPRVNTVAPSCPLP